jgi:hypothetical protein
VHDEEHMRPEDAAAALQSIGLHISVDEDGKPAIDWMGVAVRLVDRQDGTNIVVAEFGDGTLRIVQERDEAPVVEVCVGHDATHGKTWIRAVITPDWRGDGQVVLSGWDQISDALGTSETTARRYASLANHRLPVRFDVRRGKLQRGNLHPTIPLLLLQAWLRDTSFSGMEISHEPKKTVYPQKKSKHSGPIEHPVRIRSK